MTCAVPNRYSKAYEKLYIITTTNAQINIMINLWIVRLDSFSCFIEPISKAAFRVPTSIKRTAKKVGRMEKKPVKVNADSPASHAKQYGRDVIIVFFLLQV